MMAAPAHLNASNKRRSAAAAVDMCRNCERALAILGDHAPAHLQATARLRLQHPDATLAQLGELHQPPVSKDTAVGRLRRLVRMAAAADSNSRRGRAEAVTGT
jgi:DNA-binding protein WhiA